ncbi:MAG: protein BatD [Elusimicrobia bacterium]|nr:protein BatD [Elusimicrobiota bacterium]
MNRSLRSYSHLIRALFAWGPLLGVFALGPQLCWGQDISLSATVDKETVTLNDQVMLSVTVGGNISNIPDPELPSMPNFNAYSSGRSQNISIINGQVSSSVVYTYVLTPRFVGTATLGPIRIQVGGKTVQTQPIQVKVVRPNAAVQTPPPTAAPQPSRSSFPGAPDILVTASVDKKEAYVNEQITLSIKFYTAISLLGNPEYIPPQTPGFLSEDLPPLRHSQQNYKGRTYYVTEVKTALFGAQSGDTTIGPAIIRCQVQQDFEADPFSSDFFQKFFSQGLLSAQTKELRTDPIHLHIKPLPLEGKPRPFSGAVGRYTLSTSLDRKELKTGEAANLTITIQGEGNLKTVAASEIPPIPTLRVYDMVPQLSLSKEKDIVQGSKSFKTVLIPTASGKIEFPKLTFNYFDPIAHKYAHSSSPSIPLTVLPGSSSSRPLTTPLQGPSEVTQIAEDIRYIKETEYKNHLGLALSAWINLKIIHFFPLILFLISLTLSQIRNWQEKNPERFRFRRAYSQALRRVKEAGPLFSQNPSQAITLLSESLTGYLSDKLGISVSGLTLKKLMEILKEKSPQTAETCAEEIKSTWEHLDLIRFAPQAGPQKRVEPALPDLNRVPQNQLESQENQQIVKQIETLLSRLEKTLK